MDYEQIERGQGDIQNNERIVAGVTISTLAPLDKEETMKAEEIEQYFLCRSRGQEEEHWSTAGLPEGYRSISCGALRQAAAEVAAAHDTELAASEAKLAVMGEALRETETLLMNYLVAGKFPRGSDCDEVLEIVRHALSDTPEVVWSGKAEVKHSIHDGTWLLLKSEYTTLFVGKEGEVRQVFVLAREE